MYYLISNSDIQKKFSRRCGSHPWRTSECVCKSRRVAFLRQLSGSANLQTRALSHIAHRFFFWRHLSKHLFPWGIVMFISQDVALHLFKQLSRQTSRLSGKGSSVCKRKDAEGETDKLLRRVARCYWSTACRRAARKVNGMNHKGLWLGSSCFHFFIEVNTHNKVHKVHQLQPASVQIFTSVCIHIYPDLTEHFQHSRIFLQCSFPVNTHPRSELFWPLLLFISSTCS